MSEPNFEIIEHVGVIATSEFGWTKELNIIRQNDGLHQYDLRSWNHEHDEIGEGVTLSLEEIKGLADLLPRIIVTYDSIKKFKFHYERSWDEDNDYYVDFENHRYGYSIEGYNSRSKEEPIRPGMEKEFLDGLKECNVLLWDEKSTVLMCDGKSWTIEIETDKYKIKKCGYNAFPKEWEMFWKMVNNSLRTTY
ncbi:hypothetical protein JR334_07765 [Clostridia bacterium]|nr:hypothetical protein JR334_07765 [Clostridia bacterium]